MRRLGRYTPGNHKGVDNVLALIAVLLLAAAAAALAPLALRSSSAVASAPFPGWPTHYQGHALLELPLTPQLVRFAVSAERPPPW